MKSLRWAVLLAFALSACTSSTSTSPAPSQALNFNKLYITQFQSCAAASSRARMGGAFSGHFALHQTRRSPQSVPACSQMQWYTSPLSDSSTPANALSSYIFGNEAGGITFNSAGTAFVIDCCDPSDIVAFKNPIGTNAQPAFDIPLPGSVNAYNITWYKGDLWVADRGLETISMFAPPFSASSTPAFTISTAPDDPAQIAFDSSGDMAVACEDSDNVLGYAAPVTASSTPVVVLPLGTSGQGVAFDSAGNLYATLFGTGGIAVFAPPIASSSTPAFTIPTGSAPQNLEFDKHGNLWDTDATPEAQGWAPPFSGTSTPFATITNGMTTEETSLSFGP